MLPSTLPPLKLDNGLPIKSFTTSQVDRAHQGRHFLLLPAELRLICYTYAFSYPPTSIGPPLQSPSDGLQLLLTCKQIYDEACLIAFATIDFRISLKKLWCIPVRFQRLREDQIQSIRSLTFECSQLGPGDNVRLKSEYDFLPQAYSESLLRLRLHTLTFDCMKALVPGARPSLYHLPSALHRSWYYVYYLTCKSWVINVDKSCEEMYIELMSEWLDTLCVCKVVAIRHAGVKDWNIMSSHPENWQLHEREEGDRNIREITRIKTSVY